MKNGEENTFICLSFSSYSSDKLAEIAGKVAAESLSDVHEEYEFDEDFEFSIVREDEQSLADEFISDCSIFPKFNDQSESSTNNLTIPLSKLFIEDENDHDRDPTSCSSSEADESETVPAGTYCVWRPKSTECPSPSWWKKSKSTGSAPPRRWKFSDLLRRSNSDGKGRFVFLAPKHREEKPVEKSIEKAAKGKVTVSGGAPVAPSAHEVLYIWNRAVKEGRKKKSYLPYRQDLVGFFAANVNGFERRSFPKF